MAKNNAALLKKLRERDGDNCALCQFPMYWLEPAEIVEDVAREFRPVLPSIDHLVPQCHGGRHDIDNLQIAHEYCNSRRGSGPLKNNLASRRNTAVKVIAPLLVLGLVEMHEVAKRCPKFKYFLPHLAQIAPSGRR